MQRISFDASAKFRRLRVGSLLALIGNGIRTLLSYARNHARPAKRHKTHATWKIPVNQGLLTLVANLESPENASVLRHSGPSRIQSSRSFIELGLPHRRRCGNEQSETI